MKKTIICFGDSNTHGFCSATISRFDETQRWTALLAQMLGDEYDVKEEGLSGRTTVFDDPLSEGLNGLAMITPCLLTHKPVDLLIVMLGTNDTKERFACTPENITFGMERLLRKAADTWDAWRTKPNILLMAPPAILPGYIDTFIGSEMGRGCAEKALALGDLYRELADRMGYRFLDAGKIPGVEMDPHDYVHLSETAHRHLAAELSKKIPDFI